MRTVSFIHKEIKYDLIISFALICECIGARETMLIVIRRLLIHATLCWECDNIESLTPQLDKYVGFDAHGANGKELLKYLKDRLQAQRSEK